MKRTVKGGEPFWEDKHPNICVRDSISGDGYRFIPHPWHRARGTAPDITWGGEGLPARWHHVGNVTVPGVSDRVSSEKVTEQQPLKAGEGKGRGPPEPACWLPTYSPGTRTPGLSGSNFVWSFVLVATGNYYKH